MDSGSPLLCPHARLHRPVHSVLSKEVGAPHCGTGCPSQEPAMALSRPRGQASALASDLWAEVLSPKVWVLKTTLFAQCSFKSSRENRWRCYRVFPEIVYQPTASATPFFMLTHCSHTHRPVHTLTLTHHPVHTLTLTHHPVHTLTHMHHPYTTPHTHTYPLYTHSHTYPYTFIHPPHTHSTHNSKEAFFANELLNHSNKKPLHSL